MKLWLTGMSNAGNEQNLRELIGPIIEWLDGVIWVMHRPCGADPGAEYLESVKGEGKVIYRDWVSRHDFSMNETLYAGIIQEGDLVIWCDTLERPAAKFVSMIKADVDQFMRDSDVDMLAYYGKAYVFRYNEAMHYVGSPHWGLRGFQHGFELARIYPDEKTVRLNVRPQKRPDPYGFVDHYVRYFLYPPGANHALLGLEKNGDPATLFPIREKRRLEFRQELRRRGLPLTVEGVIELLKKPLDSTIKDYIMQEKIINDAYRYHVLGRKDFKDDHNWKDIVVPE